LVITGIHPILPALARKRKQVFVSLASFGNKQQQQNGNADQWRRVGNNLASFSFVKMRERQMNEKSFEIQRDKKRRQGTVFRALASLIR
jgi:hypothetical protein